MYSLFSACYERCKAIYVIFDMTNNPEYPNNGLCAFCGKMLFENLGY